MAYCIPYRAVELLIAALVGALFGIGTGIVLGYGPAYTIIWALIGAVVVGELVYWLRAFDSECPPLPAR
jgi:hypothetical protein